MNIKRIIFWLCFIVVLGLIVWGLAVAMSKAPTGNLTTSMAPAVTAVDHASGPDTVPVTIIEYSDFQCPACKAYYPIVEKLVLEASTTVRLVYRHFPLISHKNSKLAARVSEAAAVQGKFWDMYRLIFDNQASWSDLADAPAREVFRGYAERLGLDIVRYEADLDSDLVKSKVDTDLQGGLSIGVNGTPTFFVNGKVITNPPSYEEFKKLVEAAATNSTP